MKTAWQQVIIIFLMGGLLGSAITIQYMRSDDPRRNPKKFQEHMLQEFKTKLGLNEEQEQKIAVILKDTRSKLDALREEAKPRFEEIRNSSKSQIRSLLTADQRQKFDALEAEREARWKKKRKNL